jgi:2-dehydropantoate 2-reductase
MRVCVFGAGAIGGHLAARLAVGGAEVSVVGRGAHLRAIAERGLRVRAPDREMHVHPRAAEDASALGPQDAVLVTAKAPALASVAAGIGPLLGPDTAVAFVMNGIPWWYFHGHGGPHDGRRLERIDPGGAAQAAIGTSRTVGAVIYSACEVVAPGEVEVEHDRNRLILGEPDGSMSARLEAIAAPLRAGGMRVDTTDRIRDWIWSKLLMNLSSGPVAVLTQSAPKDVYAEDAAVAAARAVYAEAGAIAAALGCTPQVDVEKQLGLSRGMTHKPSILQDLERGRPMEVESIFAAPLELARMAGVPTPTLDLLVALARVRARAAGLYAGTTL